MSNSFFKRLKKEEEKPAVEETMPVSETKETKFCTNCGTEVDVNAVTCTNCGVTLSASSNTQQQKSPTKFCTNCGSEIDINAVVCPNCGVSTYSGSISQEKSTAVAIILNFFLPGLGHIYAGLTTRGLTFLILYIVSAILVFLIVGIVLMIAVWIWALVDVSKCVNALNAGEYVEDKLF